MQKACACSDSVATKIMSIMNPASVPEENDEARQLLIGASVENHEVRQLLIGALTLAHGNLISPEQRVQLLWQLWAVERFLDSNLTVPSSVLKRACSAKNTQHSSTQKDDHVFLPPIHDARLVLRAVNRAKAPSSSSSSSSSSTSSSVNKLPGGPEF
jgi:hypothetical protein